MNVFYSGKLLKPPVSPIVVSDSIDGDKNKTPERIEFEPESEYEESELEQTTHNLSASLLELSDDDLYSDSEYVFYLFIPPTKSWRNS